jgi:GNAT superfamily N-acetyltransferase
VRPSSPSLRLHPVAESDSGRLIELVAAAYAEYPGCVLDLPGVDADLLSPASVAAQRGGRWWLLDEGGRVTASVGAGAVDQTGHLELKRLYLDEASRGRGLATAMIAYVEAHAAGLGAAAVELWSDTRFAAAHHRYRSSGYTPTGESRHLGDPSDTTEYRFVKPIAAAPARHAVTWSGPHGPDRCELVDLPDGSVVRGDVGDTRYEVEVDADWRTRRAELTTADSRRRLTSDGVGRWWHDGAEAERLAGCLDVDLEVTPATNLLPIRRLGLPIGGVAEPTAAWVRADARSIEPLEQCYERSGPSTWQYRAGTLEATIEVDDEGLPVTYITSWGDELWRRAT